ncbi:MAG TPA: hypothetical protein DCW83_12325 [Saprospirales bacterium]|nr:hypothetical protein [Saprospirales bacterium]
MGATLRLVMLPRESHGYTAKESILHMLWEQDQWLEKYVKKSSSRLKPHFYRRNSISSKHQTTR